MDTRSRIENASLAGRWPGRAGRVCLALVIGGWAAAAAGAEADTGQGWLEAARQVAAAEPAPAAAPAAAAAPAEWVKPIPLSFSIDYTLVSDYIWRGVNFSEYPGERRERPNHQMGVGVSYDTGKFGTVAASFWFEWYAGQKSLDPESRSHLQEVDYTLSWSYDVEPIGLGVEVGWIAYQFPLSRGDGQTSYEWYVSLSYDDSKLFGTKSGVLNPTVAYYMDVDLAKGGQWLEFGISHDFALAEMGCGKTPVLKDLTITPSLLLGVDHRYFTSSTQLGNLTYGLAIGYDLSGALGIPARYGSLSLTGFLNFSQALALKDDVDGYQDELYGGVTIGYEW